MAYYRRGHFKIININMLVNCRFEKTLSYRYLLKENVSKK